MPFGPSVVPVIWEGKNEKKMTKTLPNTLQTLPVHLSEHKFTPLTSLAFNAGPLQLLTLPTASSKRLRSCLCRVVVSSGDAAQPVWNRKQARRINTVFAENVVGLHFL